MPGTVEISRVNDVESQSDETRLKRYIRCLEGRYFPAMTILLVLVQFCFFVANCAKHDDGDECLDPSESFDEYFSHWMWWTLGCRDHDKRLQFYRYGSSAVSHYGVTHLIPNLVITLVLGIDMELFHGPWRVLCVWVVSHCVGLWTYSGLTNLFGPNSIRKLVGSSGAAYGLMGCRVSNIALNFDTMPRQEALTRILLVVLFLAADVYTYAADRSSSVAYLAHWGGAAGGLLAGFAVFRNYVVQEGETIASFVLLAILAPACVIVAIATYLPKPVPC
ncbi:hypothetical protein CTAYLR_005585 [Chrysophaeum taylorii]|uniref:Peptidase S54 rhomboid domain-containing protein n=1 Tax=Chrysophaeum taylorii TaxID=2483200 RepID=A0AAD7XGX3_9STRA|nr:hypothetical protein CTAYLR_005585 [Chrysophaeum taylorii]